MSRSKQLLGECFWFVDGASMSQMCFNMFLWFALCIVAPRGKTYLFSWSWSFTVPRKFRDMTLCWTNLISTLYGGFSFMDGCTLLIVALMKILLPTQNGWSESYSCLTGRYPDVLGILLSLVYFGANFGGRWL